ncbi:unnamed protein product [Moneuplotes crassus]|uniref:Uncharacterized protein n=2 Tax=Euplotes crassus TaxID=5936 RepID=A0AAD1X4I7_EUPCR|nr:unnamed protein product [Moneuplotes crassus]
MKDLRLNEYFRSKDKTGVLMKRYVKMEKDMHEIRNQVGEHGVLLKLGNYVTMDLMKSSMSMNMREVEKKISGMFKEFKESMEEEIKTLVTKHTMEERLSKVQNDYGGKIHDIDGQLKWMKQFLSNRFGDKFNKGYNSGATDEKNLEDRLKELLDKVNKMDDQISNSNIISQNDQNGSILNEDTMKHHDELLKELQAKIDMLNKTINDDILAKQKALEEEAKDLSDDNMNEMNADLKIRISKSGSRRTKNPNKNNNDKMAKELKEFEFTGLKPLEEKKKTFSNYIDNELTNFKEFVKNKIEPLKSKVLRIQNEIESFKNPLLQEMIQIRTQNEALLKDLGRQKKIYREMLGEFYKMIAANEVHEQNLRVKELFSASHETKDFPISPKSSATKRNLVEGNDDWDIHAHTPKTSVSRGKGDISGVSLPFGEMQLKRPRTKSLTKNFSPKTKRILNIKRGDSNQDFSLTDNLIKMSTPMNNTVKKNLKTLNNTALPHRIGKRNSKRNTLFQSDKKLCLRLGQNSTRY